MFLPSIQWKKRGKARSYGTIPRPAGGADRLNDIEGTLVNFVKKEGRRKVRCSDNSIVGVKPENLQYSRRMGLGIRDDDDPSSWASISEEDQVEWLCNCYQLRCDDDYDKRGGKIHGPYVPDATITPESLAGDFLIFCVLVHSLSSLNKNKPLHCYLFLFQTTRTWIPT